MNNHKQQMMLAAGKEQPLSSSWLYVAIVAGVVLLGSGWLISRHNASLADNATSTTEVSGDALDVVSAVAKNEQSEPEKSVMTKPTTPTAALTTESSGEKVAISDQAAGSNVTVTGMNLGKVSWVAVRDSKTKWILGARRFEPGTKSGTVILLRPTEAGKSYEAVVYVDDGDKKFDLHKDFLVGGVTVTFKAL